MRPGIRRDKGEKKKETPAVITKQTKNDRTQSHLKHRKEKRKEERAHPELALAKTNETSFPPSNLSRGCLDLMASVRSTVERVGKKTSLAADEIITPLGNPHP